MLFKNYHRTASCSYICSGDPINWFLDNRDDFEAPIVDPKNKNFGRCGFYKTTPDSADAKGFVGCVSNSTLLENINQYLTKNKIGTCCDQYEAQCIEDDKCFQPSINMEIIFDGNLNLD